MNKIYKFNTPGNPFAGYGTPENADVLQHSISIDGNWVKYRLLADSNILVSVKFDFNSLKSNSLFADQTLWAFKYESIENSINSLNDQTDKTNFYTTLTADDIICVFKRTLPLKLPKIFESPGLTVCTLVSFFVENADITSSDLDFVFANNNITEIIKNNQPTTAETLDKFLSLPAEITCTTDKDTSAIEVGDIVNVTISTKPGIKYVYVEELNGKPNKSIVSINNGQGTFSVDTSNLVSGDLVSFKLGFKYLTGLCSFSKVIS
jgi:hypothetical protein